MKTPLRHVPTLAASILALALAGCGPSKGGGGDDDDDDDVNVDSGTDAPSCIPIAERCDNTIDDDCDNIVDCDDADCEGNPICPASSCGTLQTPEGMLALPDGACPEDETLPCAGYEDTLDFTGFSPGQTLTNINQLLGVCVTMEHSWMRDLVIYAKCPNGTKVMLSDFQGHTGGEVYLGVPNDFDNGQNPVPGTGWDYCWTPTATDAPWIPYANAHPEEHTLHSGDYQSSETLSNFVGCPLNGGWTIRVEDRWGIDNGYIFKWSVRFDPNIVEDCENWPD
jgi:hypothetical protein